MECPGAPPGLLKALGRLMMPKKEGKFRVIFNTQQTLPWLVDWMWAAGHANVQRLKWKVPFWHWRSVGRFLLGASIVSRNGDGCFRQIVIKRSEDVAGKLTTRWWYFVEQSHVCT